MLVLFLHITAASTRTGWVAPLTDAILRKNTNMSLLLIRSGADVNATSNGFTPLDDAVTLGLDSVVHTLLDAGSDANHNDPVGRAPLSKAVLNDDYAATRELLAHGANPDKADPYNSVDDPYDSAESGFPPLSDAVAIRNENISLLLIESGANPNATDPDGFAPLDDAVSTRQTSVAQALLDAGADANRADPFGRTPLSQAVRNGDAAIAQDLIAHGANPNAVDPEGYTPINDAVNDDNVPIASLLAAHGADLGHAPPRDLGPLEQALRSDQREMAAMLLEAGAPADAEALTDAARNDNTAAAIALAKRGADTNVVDQYDMTPINYAVVNEDVLLAKTLIERGADVNHKRPDVY